MHIYVHIPFCLKKCGYCDFASSGVDEFEDGPPLKEYFEALKKEIISRANFFDKKIADTIYFGGGTPATGGVDNIIDALGFITDIFPSEPACEITIENNPEALTAGEYRRLLEAGFNRISIGIQSLDDGVLKILGRLHDSHRAVCAIENSINAGFKNISADFMIGTVYPAAEEPIASNFDDQFLKYLQHISVYQFSVADGTAIKSMVDNGALIELDDERMAREYHRTCFQLKKAGFDRYEISNFARGPEYISKHNYSYWAKKDYAGFGAGAVSTFKNTRRCNNRKIYEYIKHAGTGKEHEIEKLSPGEQFIEKIMLALRTSHGLTPDITGEKMFKKLDEDPIIKKLTAEGYVQYIKNKKFSLNTEGFMVMNDITLKVIDALTAGRSFNESLISA